MRTVTIHQPEHLPWLGFFYKVAQADALVVLDNVQFRKNYFGNRNRLLGPNGPYYVTVPIRLKGHMELEYREIQIADERGWKDRYRKSVLFHYRKHPFFDLYWPDFDRILSEEWQHLAPLNEALIRWMLECFGIRPEIVRASDLGASGRSTGLLVDLCRRMKADRYLAGALGKDYMDEEAFRSAGIRLDHTDFSHPTYPQRGGREFVAQLSALDLLMNCGPESQRFVGSRAWIISADRST